MHYPISKTVRPDAKGRITLGEFAKGISGYHMEVTKDGHIILEPLVEIPAREKWLIENKAAMRQVQKGIKDAAQGKVVKRGDFSKYLDEELD